MTVYAVDVNLFDRKGNPYRTFGLAEYEDVDAYEKAFEYAHKRVTQHANAAAQILRNGDPYAWVYNGVTDCAGVARRDTEKPRVEYVGGSAPDWAYA